MSYARDDAREVARNALAFRLAGVRQALRAQDELRETEARLTQELRALSEDEPHTTAPRAAVRATLPSGLAAAVASPCSEDWDAMVGDDRVRHCSRCQKSVYNVSALTAREAEAFLAQRGERCIRFFRRRDGTLLTSDCPVGRPRKIALRVLTAVAVAIGASAAGYATSRFTGCYERGHIDGDFTTGGEMPTS